MEDELFQKTISALSKKIDYIVVGGRAWEKSVVSAGTPSIALTSENYEQIKKEIPEILEKTGINTILREDDPVMSLFEVRKGQKSMELEVINSRYYSTEKEEFYGYAKQYRSFVENGIRYAKPELVWYMRLSLPYWETYIYKCIHELTIVHKTKKDFRLDELLKNVLEIAEVFGTKEKVKPRIKALKNQTEKMTS